MKNRVPQIDIGKIGGRKSISKPRAPSVGQYNTEKEFGIDARGGTM